MQDMVSDINKISSNDQHYLMRAILQKQQSVKSLIPIQQIYNSLKKTSNSVMNSNNATMRGRLITRDVAIGESALSTS